MTKPIVSILMPMKNPGIFLKACLDSILEQTFKNWELVVVDDHSTDDSCSILQTYVQKDNRIKILKNKGQGIIMALRLAYQQASGQYITRMDSDDKMTPDKLNLLLKQLQSNGSGHIAVGFVEYFSDSNLQSGYQKYAQWLNNLTSKAANFSDIYKECTIPSPCWMVHREDLDDCGGFEPDLYPEDYDLAFRFRKIGLKIIPVRKVIHHWRDYETRTSRTDERYTDNRFFELKILYFLKQDRHLDRRLILWGAGRKGKKIARLLNQEKRSFDWICNNPKKIGKEIYNTQLSALDTLNTNPAQILVAVSSPKDSFEVEALILKYNQHQYFRFC